MSKHDWKPGDVAMRAPAPHITDRTEMIAMATTCHNDSHGGGRQLHWHHVGGGWDPMGLTMGPIYRPLVVIDPENREQVERLHQIYASATPEKGRRGSDFLVYALREFANPKPPKPDEPQGLGAVVEDADGVRWVRSTGAHEKSRWASNLSLGTWADINAVRVLSEGVQP